MCSQGLSEYAVILYTTCTLERGSDICMCSRSGVVYRIPRKWITIDMLWIYGGTEEAVFHVVRNVASMTALSVYWCFHRECECISIRIDEEQTQIEHCIYSTCK